MDEGAIEKIKQAIPTLADAERRIASFIVTSPQKALHLNISELARQANTSPAAVVRFCRHVGAENIATLNFGLQKMCIKGGARNTCRISSSNRRHQVPVRSAILLARSDEL